MPQEAALEKAKRPKKKKKKKGISRRRELSKISVPRRE